MSIERTEKEPITSREIIFRPSDPPFGGDITRISDVKTNSKRTRHANYPWTQWIRSGTIRLRAGRDYDCTDRSMAQQIRNAALREGLSVSVGRWVGGVTATFSGRR